MSEKPFVSVITVNWNGLHFLKDWLPSITKLNYPNYEVIVVDNASHDGSVEYIEENFPKVRIIKNKKNRAFAGGNNDGIRLAIKEGKAKYIALINNDTKVDENWLTELINTAENGENIGAVGSKLLFYKPFVTLTLKTETFNPENDARELGTKLWWQPYFKRCDYAKRIWGKGFYPEEYDEGREFRWTQNKANIGIPVDSINKFTLKIKLSGHKDDQIVKLFIGKDKFTHLKVNKKLKEYNTTIPQNIIAKNKYNVIQNAGSIFDTTKFEGGDRGMYEVDKGQYDKQEEVGNLCGASMLIPINVLKEAGMFDEYFFMYYEDTDLCQRIKKAGYKLIYNPKSLVRHVHTGSSKEWSPFFVYQVERNRIANALKNAKTGTIGFLIIRILKIWTSHVIKAIRHPKDAKIRVKAFVYTKVLCNLSINWPQLLFKRFGIIKLK